MPPLTGSPLSAGARLSSSETVVGVLSSGVVAGAVVDSSDEATVDSPVVTSGDPAGVATGSLPDVSVDGGAITPSSSSLLHAPTTTIAATASRPNRRVLRMFFRIVPPASAAPRAVGLISALLCLRVRVPDAPDPPPSYLRVRCRVKRGPADGARRLARRDLSLRRGGPQ